MNLIPKMVTLFTSTQQFIIVCIWLGFYLVATQPKSNHLIEKENLEKNKIPTRWWVE